MSPSHRLVLCAVEIFRRSLSALVLVTGMGNKTGLPLEDRKRLRPTNAAKMEKQEIYKIETVQCDKEIGTFS